MVTILTKDPFELVENIGDLTFEHVKRHLSISEEHGGVIEEVQRKPEDEYRNLADVKENNNRLESFEKVEDNNEDVCRDGDREKTENKEWLLQLEKDAGEAVARAAEAVSDLVTDRRPVQETILVIAEASAAVLALAESLGEEAVEAELVQRRILSLHQLAILSTSKAPIDNDDREQENRLHPHQHSEGSPCTRSSKAVCGKKKRQGGKEELRKRQEEHLRRSLVVDDPL